MDALSIFVRGAHANAWANHRLLGACALLDHHSFHATRVAFFPSLHTTLNHILIVDWYYIDALTRSGRGLACFQDATPFAEFAPLAQAQRTSDRALIAFTTGLSAGNLDEIVELGRRDHVQRERLGDVLLHLYQHQIHHRGQAHAMLSGTRIAPPQLDEFYMAEELPLRRDELVELGLPLV